jgi:hypothetical protein
MSARAFVDTEVQAVVLCSGCGYDDTGALQPCNCRAWFCRIHFSQLADRSCPASRQPRIYDLGLIQIPDSPVILPGMRGWKLLASLLYLTLPSAAAAAELSNEQIRQALMQQSIAAHAGNCACPYQVDRAGRKCGRRSAYSKQGGDEPLCYASDVTPEMIASFRNR